MLNRAIKIYRNINQLQARMGWLDTWLVILNRLLVKGSRGTINIYKYQLVAQPVSNKPFLTPTRGRKIVIRQIDRYDPVIQFFPRPISTIHERFKNGAICLVAFKGEKFVGFIWLMFGAYEEDEVRARYIPLPAKRAAWDFDVYVDSDHRLGFTFLRLWDEANQLLSENGFEWSCSRISSFNPDSLRSHTGLGAVVLGKATFIRLAGWQITLASIRPYINISFNSNYFPQFFLDTSQLKNPFLIKDNKTALDSTQATRS